MTLKECKKALAAFAGTALSAYVAAWAQAPGSTPPGWTTVAMAVGLGIPAALLVFGVRNASPRPPYTPVPGTSAATMATRAAARSKPGA